MNRDDQVFQKSTDELLHEFLASMSPEERLQGLRPEERLKGLTPVELLQLQADLLSLLEKNRPQ